MKKHHRILVVDDDLVNVQKFSLYLQQDHYEVINAFNGREALELLGDHQIDMVLLDVMMPVMDGWLACKAMKKDHRWRDIPVIFFTSLSEPEEIVHGFDVGAVDFVSKTCSEKELRARVRTHLELRDHRHALQSLNESLKKEIEQRTKVEEQLLLAYSEMEKLAKTDPLTRLDNRRNAMDLLKMEESRFKRTGKGFCLIMGDVDLFKIFNDTHGHECGDYVLTEVSKLLKSSVRAHDHVARWGGEEILMILPETNKHAGFEIAEKIRALLDQTAFEYEGMSLKISMTFGISDTYDFPGFENALRKADEALYKGKRQGRNVSILAG